VLRMALLPFLEVIFRGDHLLYRADTSLILRLELILLFHYIVYIVVVQIIFIGCLLTYSRWSSSSLQGVLSVLRFLLLFLLETLPRILNLSFDRSQTIFLLILLVSSFFLNELRPHIRLLYILLWISFTRLIRRRQWDMIIPGSKVLC